MNHLYLKESFGNYTVRDPSNLVAIRMCEGYLIKRLRV